MKISDEEVKAALDAFYGRAVHFTDSVKIEMRAALEAANRVRKARKAAKIAELSKPFGESAAPKFKDGDRVDCDGRKGAIVASAPSVQQYFVDYGRGTGQHWAHEDNLSLDAINAQIAVKAAEAGK